MERAEQISEVAEQVHMELTQRNYEKICEYYNANKDAIVSDFYDAINRLITLTKEHQNSFCKKAVQYVAVSYLLSSTITKSYEFQLSLMSEQYFLDPIESCIYWSPHWLFTDVDKDWNMLFSRVRKEIIRLHPYELDRIWRSYICSFYYGLTALFVAEHIKAAAISGGLEDLRLAKEVSFIYGGIMNQFVQLDGLRTEKENEVFSHKDGSEI